MGTPKAIVASYVGVLLYAGFVFVGAWRMAYWQGLLYVALALVGVTLTHVLAPAGSSLTADRARDAKAGRSWDKRLLGAMFLVNIVTFVVAGMDSGRFGWTGPVPMWVTGLGASLMVAGQALFAFARRQNAFFASTVTVQPERGHQVSDSGLYRVVRHPGYAGMLLSQLAFSLVMNSYWALVPAAVGAVLLVLRTSLEDATLLAELPGYAEYARRTQARLVPGIY